VGVDRLVADRLDQETLAHSSWRQPEHVAQLAEEATGRYVVHLFAGIERLNDESKSSINFRSRNSAALKRR
jgi:hypothetical protein